MTVKRGLFGIIALLAVAWLLARPSDGQAPAQGTDATTAPAATPAPARRMAQGGQTYTVEMSGTMNLRFAGTCMVVGSGGNTKTGDLAGTLPTRFQFQGSMISCTAQNQGDYGSMKMVIMRGSEIVAQSQTSQPYGAIAAAGR